MAQPITWRNVEAPDLRGAASMLQLANNGFNSGFDKLNQVLQSEQATAEANWKVQRDNNTQAFLDSINQYRTAEEFQAAQQSGALGQLRSQFGNQIDRAAIRTAEDGRLATLQGRDVQAINYGNTMTDAKEDPIKRAATAALISGDRATYERLVAENPNARFLPEVMDKNRTVTHQNTEWERDGIKFDRDGKKLDSELLTESARRKLLGAQVNQANAAAENYRSESSSATASLKAQLAASKAEKAAAEELIKNSPLDAGTMDTGAGQKAFEAELGKLDLPKAQLDNIRKEYVKQFSNGITLTTKDGAKVNVPLPVSTALAAVKGSEDDWIRANWASNSYRGVNAAKKLKELIADPTYVDNLSAAMQAQGIQYRPLQSKEEGGASVPKRRSIFPQEDGEDTGVISAKAQQTINSRLEKVRGMMTAKEIEEAKTGKLPFRIKQLLEERD